RAPMLLCWCSRPAAAGALPCSRCRRDLWVEVPGGYGYSRINAAYVLGEVTGYPGGGMALARDTVAALLGMPIDYVVVADFMGFIAMIDVLGGVTVHVETELYDAQFPTMDYGYTVAHFVPGLQQMDGQTALMYSRIRHPDSDFMRIRRQQVVVAAVGARLRERGDVQNVLAADSITGALLPFVRTDMPRERMVGLLWSLREFRLERVERYAVDGTMVSSGVGADLYALVPIPGALEALTAGFRGGGTPLP
ncbi:MAG: LCP family protein, partial [Chloroflexaceae bacterium]|nr:LCP family protein [Chloroflexaceae bacterium]